MYLKIHMCTSTTHTHTLRVIFVCSIPVEDQVVIAGAALTIPLNSNKKQIIKPKNPKQFILPNFLQNMIRYL